MPLVPMTEILSEARRLGYAVCYCEAWNLESFEGVLDAAEEACSPIIAGFNGGFLGHAGRPKPENLGFYAGMGRVLAEVKTPAAFLLNETDDVAQIARGIELGFNSVMVENEHLGADEYLGLVRGVVAMARPAGVSVEAAVGRLYSSAEQDDSRAEVTDPAAAKAFVAETGVDALAVSVGNVHILTRGKAGIDLELLRRIGDAVSVPLVLHGGTGIPLDHVEEFIKAGVAKINFGTTLKQAYLAALRESLAPYREPLNPHPFMGTGGNQDILMAGRQAVKSRTRELLACCGSAGRSPKA